MRGTLRIVVTGVAVLVAFVLQTSVLPRMGWPDAGLGLVPDLVLLVVVATALLTDTRFATLTGFAAGLLVDLAPPADHAAGRWALALMLVGYVIGRLSHDHTPATASGERPGLGVALAAVIGGSFLGTSVFALSGLLLGDTAVPIGDLLRVVGISGLLDLIAGLVVLPVMVAVYAAVGRSNGDSGRVTPRPRVRQAVS